MYNAFSLLVNGFATFPILTGPAKLACSQLNCARTHLFKYQLTPMVVSAHSGLDRLALPAVWWRVPR